MRGGISVDMKSSPKPTEVICKCIKIYSNPHTSFKSKF